MRRRLPDILNKSSVYILKLLIDILPIFSQFPGYILL
jgi:hypothetical protein